MHPLHECALAVRKGAVVPNIRMALLSVALLAMCTGAHAAASPSATSGQASRITASSATLSGTVDANNAAATAYFDFGTTNVPYSSKLPGTPGTVTGTNVVNVTGVATGLSCGTTYHWRMHAVNSLGQSKGADRTFTTAACGTAASTPPAAATSGVSGVTQAGATLNASVIPGSAAATASFEWGSTTAYGSTLAATPSTLAASTTATQVSAGLSGLACGTAYHFRAKATSTAGSAVGVDQAFNTAACATPTTGTAPSAVTGAASATASSATLNGSVVAGSATATVTFQWGATTAYGNAVSATPATLAASSSATPVGASLSGLACGTTYQYRVSATSTAGTGTGSNGTFSTTACSTPTGGASLRVSVGGFGQVTSDVGGISCGSVPAGAAGSSSRCFSAAVSGNVTLTATPFNSSFVFAGWSGDAACAGNTCTVPAIGAKWVRAKFAPATSATNACTALGLVGDKANHPLNANYPALAVGQSFVDPNFKTTIRRLTDVKADGRGGSALVPAYSTISAFNADESYLILYRAGVGHELYDGKTYRFIRALDDLPTADVEQFYWDTTRPNIVYGASGTTLYRYDVNAASGQRLTALRNFGTQCGAKQLYGGSDPFFNSWDSRVFGLTCASNGATFSYDAVSNTLGAVASAIARADGYTAPQASPSGRKLILNQPSGTNHYVRVFDLNLVGGPQLDQASGDEHASMSMLSNGNDTYNAIQFDPGPSGTPEGSLVQFNLDSAANAANRITGRVIVGPTTGYPYPPGGTHIGAAAFHRTGVVGVSIIGTGTGASVLDNELLLVDTDSATNPSNAVCRVGHHRSNSGDYWAEPHASVSPSGTRIVFGSSWGNSSATAPSNAYVVELPGYRP
ncbi:MAG: hypothetical protein ACM3SO_17280 [Betaproteobacteria bacterium]